MESIALIRARTLKLIRPTDDTRKASSLTLSPLRVIVFSILPKKIKNPTYTQKIHKDPIFTPNLLSIKVFLILSNTNNNKKYIQKSEEKKRKKKETIRKKVQNPKKKKIQKPKKNHK
jgi:hypothetical protein